MRSKNAVAAVFLALLVISSGAVWTVEFPTRSADELLENTLTSSPVALPGVVAAVWKEGRPVYAGAAGWADVASQQPATTDTRFRIYSTSKPLTAVAAFRLAEKGILDLDRSIASYLLDLPEALRPITTRQLLAHRSGVRHYRSGEWLEVSDRHCVDPLEALSDFVHDPLAFPPGSDTLYTSFGYVLLSAVLQSASGKPYADLMAEEVFSRARMRATAMEGTPIEGLPLATFYLRKENEEFVPTDTLKVDSSCKFGGGGLVATARDLAAFGAALIEGRLLSQQSLQQFTSVVTPAAADGSFPPIAHGIFVEEAFPAFGEDTEVKRRSRAFWHGGSARGGYSVMIVYPDERVSVGIITNVRASGFLILRAHQLATLFF